LNALDQRVCGSPSQACFAAHALLSTPDAVQTPRSARLIRSGFFFGRFVAVGAVVGWSGGSDVADGGPPPAGKDEAALGTVAPGLAAASDFQRYATPPPAATRSTVSPTSQPCQRRRAGAAGAGSSRTG
jgi:hypothetical protein